MMNPLSKVKNNKFSSMILNKKVVKIDINMVSNILKPREEEGYKGDFGHVLIIAGSVGFCGAAYLTTEGAVKSGVGLATLCVPKEIQEIMSIKLNEAMTINYEDKEKIANIMIKSDCIAVGPGMGNSKLTYNVVRNVIENAECPIVIDADGLNVLQNNLELLQLKNDTIILTPHYGEMARLTGLSVEEVKEDRIHIAKQFAYDNDVILLLKDHRTLITDGNYVFENTTGNSAMSSRGMGDTLTGIIASFIAQGYRPLEATYIAAFVHGYCGDLLGEKMFCVNAMHLVEELPYAIIAIIDGE